MNNIKIESIKKIIEDKKNVHLLCIDYGPKIDYTYTLFMPNKDYLNEQSTITSKVSIFKMMQNNFLFEKA